MASFNERGFVLPARPLLSPEEVVHHARVWEELFEAYGEGDGYGINGFFKRFGACWDLTAHPNVVQVARDLLGTNVACWGAHYICKLPGEDDLSPVGLHPDGSPACHQDVRAAELSLQGSPEV